MKIFLKLLPVILMTTGYLNGCPTCVGRITKETKPFFSREFYTSYKSMDHLYQALQEPSDKKEQPKPAAQIAENSSSTPTEGGNR